MKNAVYPPFPFLFFNYPGTRLSQDPKKAPKTQKTKTAHQPTVLVISFIVPS